MKRQCGFRKKGGVYLTVPAGPDGAPIEMFLLDPPQPVELDALGLTPRGVQLIEKESVRHVFDVVGQDSYPNVADFVEECLLPDEDIVTENGLRPIKEISPGDRVLTHKGRFQPVTDLIQHNHIGGLISLKTAYYQTPLRLTPEHPVLRAKVLRGRERRRQEGCSGERVLDRSFVPAREVEVGDYLCFPILRENEDVAEVEMTYVTTYPVVHGNAKRSLELQAQALELRAPEIPVRQAQHQLLRRLSDGESRSFHAIYEVARDLYAYGSGLARSLRKLVARGLLEKSRLGKYHITERGKIVASEAYASYAKIGSILGVKRALAYHLVKDPLSDKARTIAIKFPLNDSLLQLAGYYLAEGSVIKRRKGKDGYHGVEFSFGLEVNAKEYSYALSVKKAANTLGWGASIRLKDGCWNVIVSSRHLSHWLVDNFGKGARHKYLPTWVLRLPPAKLNIILETYLNGDGHRAKNCRIGTTASPRLAHGLMMLANKIGCRASIRFNPQNGSLGGQGIYLVKIYSGTGLMTFSDGEYIYLKVTERLDLEYAGQVYNLSVAEDESYCTTYHTVHNCRQLGVSRRCELLDYSKLTKESRLVLIHQRAFIENYTEYLGRFTAQERDEFRCPRVHHKIDRLEEMCAGLWRHDVVEGIERNEEGSRDLASRKLECGAVYRCYGRPIDVTPEYQHAIFAIFPIGQIEVIEDPDDRTHEKKLERASKSQLPVALVSA